MRERQTRLKSVETNLWNNSKIFLWSYSVETLKYFLAISVCICYLESTHCQIVLITGVSCETKHCEGDWSGSQASQSQFPLTGVSLLQQRRQLQNCDLQKIQPATIVTIKHEVSKTKTRFQDFWITLPFSWLTARCCLRPWGDDSTHMATRRSTWALMSWRMVCPWSPL